jgi:peptidyl-prolyl cis-trans isomerase C
MTNPAHLGNKRQPRRYFGLLGLTLAAFLAVTPLAVAQDADPVIARVNGVEIRNSDLAIVEEELGQAMAQVPPEARKEYLTSLLIDTVIVAQAAEAKGAADAAEFKRRLAFNRNRILSEGLLSQEAKAAVTDEALRKTYEEAIKQMGSEQEVRARHILFRVADPKDEKASKAAEDKIKAVIARLKKGEDFVKLASELTEDPSGKENGGDLGYFTKDQMVPEFSDVAFKLEKGGLSEPVKTQFGWHVLKVEDKRNRPAPEFDKVRGQLEQYVVRKAQSDLVAKLRASAKIERTDAPAAPGAPAAPAEKK